MILLIALGLSCLFCFLLFHSRIARPNSEKGTQPREVVVDNGMYGVHDAKAEEKTA